MGSYTLFGYLKIDGNGVTLIYDENDNLWGELKFNHETGRTDIYKY